MKDPEGSVEFDARYKRLFEKLKPILYKEVFINDIGIRVSSIHFMDPGVDWYVNLHRHSFYELHYATKGNVYTTLDTTEYRINERQFYIIPAETLHSHRQDPGTRHYGVAVQWEFLNQGSYFPSKSINGLLKAEEFFELFSNNKQFLPADDDSTVLKALVWMLEMADQGYEPMLVQLAFCQFLLRVCEFYRNTTKQREFTVNDAFLQNETVKKAIKFMEENYAHDINVYDISSATFVSYSRLSRLFRQTTGLTMIDYLNSIRLEKALTLIKCTQKSICEIAYEVGFNNANYFSSVFAKTYGVPPTAMRRSNLSTALSD